MNWLRVGSRIVKHLGSRMMMMLMRGKARKHTRSVRMHRIEDKRAALSTVATALKTATAVATSATAV